MRPRSPLGMEFEGRRSRLCRSTTRYLASIVVTLRAGNVIFSEVPLAAVVTGASDRGGCAALMRT
jgi:hypothetical protein